MSANRKEKGRVLIQKEVKQKVAWGKEGPIYEYRQTSRRMMTLEKCKCELIFFGKSL